MILLIYQIRRVVDYEMKLYLKNRICPLIFKRTPTLNEIHAIVSVLSLIMLIIVFNTITTFIHEFRAENVAEYQRDIYGNCRITAFVSEIIDGEHIMSYVCTETVTDVQRTDNAPTQREQRQILIDEREIHGMYNYMNQKIRIMRTPNFLTYGLYYDIYHRTFEYSPETPTKYEFNRTPYE
jgi:hypothetical protein